MNSYRELKVWQKSFQLAILIYQKTKQLPKEELYGLVSQMRRAAVSIPSNIAEGFNRRTRKDYGQFVRIAFGSGAELETQLLLAKDLGYLSQTDFDEGWQLLEEVMRMLNRLAAQLE